MTEHQNAPPHAGAASVHRVPAGADRFGEHRGLGVSTIEFKVAGAESPGLLVLENSFHAKGGPARHLHVAQDEWFYAVEGEFVIEIGTERHRLGPGDSVVAPRQVPHVWAHVGEGRGRILVAFTPAGQMEAFFRVVTARNAMPPQDPALWRAHGMELLGPPLALP
jgi:mannose-6-phosphate isomerase-like protein (cupin superfamily)